MKKALWLLFLTISLFAASISHNIHVDHFGYPTTATKVAVLSQAQEGFNAPEDYIPGDSLVVRHTASGTIVFKGAVTQWKSGQKHSQSGDKGWWFNFSTLTDSGIYEIYDPANYVVSVPFTIEPNPWQEILKTALKVFYYQRLGYEKTEEFAGAYWKDEASFLQDSAARSVFDQNNEATERNMSGGWYDAGDYNKYITFAYSPLIHLFDAYEQNPQVWGDDFDIPESGNSLPDLLDEVKWEMDWMLRMQDSDGGVFIKIGDKEYGSTTPPSSNKKMRYYGAKSSAATICFASATARAAAIYRTFPQWEKYADTLQSASIKAWNHYHSNEKNEDVDKGEVKSGDADKTIAEQKMVAACASVHLWQLTGEEKYHDSLKNGINFLDDWEYYWGQYHFEIKAVLMNYAVTEGADNDLSNKIRSYAKHTLTNSNCDWTGLNDVDLYRAHMNDNEYNWGSNSLHAITGILNYDAITYDIDTENNEAYRTNAMGHIHYIHGVNPLNKVYLSRMEELGGENSVRELYHSWFSDGSDWDNADTSKYGPAPGYIVGGPNKNYTIEGTFPYGELPQKAYKEWNTGYPENSWEITEPAIYYQAHYVKLLSYFVAEGQSTPLVKNQVDSLNSNSPKLQNGVLSLSGFEKTMQIFDLRGRELVRENIGKEVRNISLRDFAALGHGLYIVKISSDLRAFNFSWATY